MSEGGCESDVDASRRERVRGSSEDEMPGCEQLPLLEAGMPKVGWATDDEAIRR